MILVPILNMGVHFVLDVVTLDKWCFSLGVYCAGGEGSILGAGGSVIGVGSDIGGSIRMPCFFNGIFGHKPTPGT